MEEEEGRERREVGRKGGEKRKEIGRREDGRGKR